jgi:hypothetical protein
MSLSITCACFGSDYAVLKRERNDVQTKLATALSVTKDAKARADKAEKALATLKKKRGKLSTGAAKQWDKERSELVRRARTARTASRNPSRYDSRG